MQRSHLFILAFVVVVVIVITVASTVPWSTERDTVVLPDRLDAALCPAEYGNPRPLLVVSLDGFRPDYLRRKLNPTLELLREKGVHAPHMLPVYPTKTFPNHYSIVTGLYPESHGIIDNVFWDPTFAALFTLRAPAATNGTWWGGEPIWNTLTRQGKKSATFFWPGSEADIGNQQPTHWRHYNGSVPFRERVSQVLEWLSLPPEKRPSWVSLYFDEPDRQGHATGPSSPGVDEQLRRVEERVAELVAGLASRDLLHCVNLLMVSDHGMAQGKAEGGVIDLATTVPDIQQLANVFFGPIPRLMMKVPGHEAAEGVVSRLTAAGLRVFYKADLPKRLHYFNNRRINSIVLDLDPGYSVKDARPNAKPRPPPQGLHGYDFYNPEMNALFMGYGPDLAQGKTVEPFHNIELYNLMCELIGVEPAPNNGTWGALHHLLAAPPALPALPQAPKVVPLGYPEAAPAQYQVAAGCSAGQRWNAKMKPRPVTERAEGNVTVHLLPWGPPTSAPASAPAPPVLLLHHSHATGYSRELKVPLWTSFTVSGEVRQPYTPGPWLADARLEPHEVPTCRQYDSHPNFTMTRLFPPRYVPLDTPPEEADLITNAVAVGEFQQGEGVAQRWRHLTEELIPAWQSLHGPLNVVLGLIHDADDDGRLDDLKATGSFSIPSDLFAVVTRCLEKVTSLGSCPASKLDAVTFIYPQVQHSFKHADGETYARMYSARVRDAELLTGLAFFPDLAPEDRLRLVLRSHTHLWPTS